MVRSPLRLLAPALSVFLVATPVARAGDPRLVWKTIETEHFVINYYEPNEPAARRVAAGAEKAHRLLTASLRYEPWQKTQIVLIDNNDSANGFASVAPRNQITLFLSAPSSTSVLNDHDDWLFGLVLHEYAHIVHLDITGGLPRWWNRVWGKTWMPNQIQPRWVIEGIATYEESKRTSSGRVRSAIFDMYLRTAVLEGKELGLDQISSGPRLWPHGNSFYLYGSHFLDYVSSRFGEDTIAHMSHEYGTHPIPWNFGRALRGSTGKNLDELYDDWRAYLHRKYTLQKVAVERRGVREGRKMTDTGETNSAPRYSADGRQIFWIRSDGYSRPRYRQMPSGHDASLSKDLAILDGASVFDVLPDGSGLLVQRSANFETNYDFADLYIYRFASRTLERLTWGLRALDPAVSPDGRRAAFVINGQSRRRLAIMPLRPRATPEILWEGEEYFDQAFSPAWSPDGERIAFSGWTKGGYRDLFVTDVQTRQTRRLMRDRAIDAEPAWSPDGKWIYYTSDRSGIYNLYAIDPETGEVKQVTNVLGGVFFFDVSPDGKRVVYQGFDADGHEIYEMELDPATWLEPEVYVNDRPDPVEVSEEATPMSEPRPYDPLHTLRPYSWTAQLTLDSFGDAVSASTRGNDVAGFHSWFVGATFGLTRGDVSFGATYSYNRLWPGLTLAGGRSLRQPGGLILDGRSHRYTEELYSVTGSARLPWVRLPEWSSDLFLSYDVDWFRNIDGEVVYDPNAAVPRLPETGVVAGPSVRVSVNDLHRFVYTLGPAEGRTLSIGARYNHPVFGSDFKSLRLSYGYQEFLQLPFGHHILAMRLTGGYVDSERRREGDFVLGGIPNQDLFDAILNSTRVGSTGYLRGYRPGALRGNHFHLANVEYRIPLYDIERGVSTLPFYVRRLHAGLLFDAGTAFRGTPGEDDLRLAVGGSLRLDMSFGFFAAGTFDLGLARGLSRDGETQYWFFLTSSL